MANGLHASDEPIDRESLRSLDGVRVDVEDVPANAPKDLQKESLVRFVEARLEAAHVPLQGHGEYPVGDPFLRVIVKTTGENGGPVAYHIDVEFMQIVFVRRNPQLTFNRAQTWAANARMGLVPRAELVERIHKDLAEQLDQFIAAYKSVN
jgi:hypothetical protein